MTKNKKITNLKIGELPTLKVIPISKAIFHEEPDKGRLLNLIDRFGTEGVLKNPPIVAKIKNKKNYVILDGANRVTALIKHGFKHVLVQVVDFEDQFLRLHCWHHAVEKLDREYFLNKIKQFPGIEITLNENNNIDDEHDLEAVNSNGFLCRMYFSDGRSAMARNGGDIPEQVDQLCQITDLYLPSANYDRVSYINRAHLMKHYPDFRTLLTFRHFQKDDFVKIIETGKKLPAGVTRVFLPKRALGLNVQLEFLKSGLTLEEKNLWLEEMILKKVREKSIRFYREPTFVFDE